jgi:hypothetical protein
MERTRMAFKDKPVVIPAEHVTRIVEHLYADTAPLQWVRETYANLIEAGATRGHYGIEWQGVESSGVYRRYVADDGCGMDADELEAYFSKIGESGKFVGTRYDNRGVGAKLTLLPWNHAGVVIVSWKDGDANMIWIRRDEHGHLGLRTWDTADGLDNVVQPHYDPEVGVDFARIGPDWVREDGGTVFLLLGPSLDYDSILGDPERPQEASTKAVQQYLNTRLLTVDAEITFEAFNHTDPAEWPKSYAEARESVTGERRLYQENRRVEGALYFLAGEAAEDDQGMMLLSDESKIHWFLGPPREKARSGGGYMPADSFIAFAYEGELFNVTEHRSSMRSFGIFTSSVAARLRLLIELPPRDGIAMTLNRDQLKYEDGTPVRFDGWADAFRANIPERIAREMREQVIDIDAELDEYGKKLMSKYARRLRSLLLRASDDGDERTTPVLRGGRRRRGTRVRGPIVNPGETHAKGGSAGEVTDGTTENGDSPASEQRVEHGLPQFKIVRDEISSGLAAQWDAESECGYLSTTHPVVARQLAYWQGLYEKAGEDIVELHLLRWYQSELGLKVAHAESLRADLTPQQIELMLTPEALTMGLLGLKQDDAVLQPELGGVGIARL